MKYITILFLLINYTAISQSAKYQTYTADLTIIATKDSQDVQWQNKSILVNMDYKTGKITIEINNSDFFNKSTQEKAREGEEVRDTKYTLVGMLPIDQIINQKQSNQEYTVELQLINDDIDFRNVLNFKMNVMRTSQQSGSYRVFTFSGLLYNDELKLPAFKGYDNEVEIRIMFNAFWNN